MWQADTGGSRVCAASPLRRARARSGGRPADTRTMYAATMPRYAGVCTGAV